MKTISEFLNRLSDDLEPIKTQAVKYLDKHSKITDSQTVQIFKRPWVAPHNYGITLYPPIQTSWLTSFQENTGKKIPEIYETILREMNGCDVYDFSLYGMPPSMYTTGLQDRCKSQPLDLAEANTNWICEYDVNPHLFHIGGCAYTDDENIGYFLDKASILSVRTNGEIIRTYQSFSDFLTTEISQAEQMMLAEKEEYS